MSLFDVVEKYVRTNGHKVMGSQGGKDLYMIKRSDFVDWAKETANFFHQTELFYSNLS